MSRQIRITELLTQELEPSYLQVEDESKNHHVPENAQTHFKVIAVSTKFDGLTPIARHRLLNNLLAPEFSQGMHALSLHLFTQEEWVKRSASLLKSPACRDGFNT